MKVKPNFWMDRTQKIWQIFFIYTFSQLRNRNQKLHFKINVIKFDLNLTRFVRELCRDVPWVWTHICFMSKHIQVLHQPRFSRESLVLTVRICVQQHVQQHVQRPQHHSLVVRYKVTWREDQGELMAWLHFYVFFLVEIVEWSEFSPYLIRNVISWEITLEGKLHESGQWKWFI